jgi:hypothetical protein
MFTVVKWVVAAAKMGEKTVPHNRSIAYIMHFPPIVALERLVINKS